MKTVAFKTLILACILQFDLHIESLKSQDYKSDSSWFVQESNTTQSLRDIFFINDTIGWSVGDYGTILKTINGGETWNAQDAGSNLYKPYDVFFIDENIGWISLINSGILKTTNGGITWSLVYTGFSLLQFDIFFTDAHNGWISGTDQNSGEPDEAMILKTTDGGNNWIKQFSDTSDVMNLRCLHFLDSLTGWIGGELKDPWGSTGIVYKTIDGGNNWELLSDSLESFAEGIQFVNDYVGWVTGGATGYIAKSIDGGITWETQRIGVDEWYHSLYFSNNYTGWVVGSGTDQNTGVILKTINGGETWDYQFAGETLPLAAVNFTNDYFGWVVGIDGFILHTKSGGEDISIKKYDRNNLNKSIYDFQTTEDELIVEPYRISNQSQSLIGVEIFIDEVLHTSDGDLEFTLSHSDISVSIIHNAGGDGDNFIGTKLTDNGIDSISNGIAPFAGNYKPENPLSSFLETDPSGTWTLSIYDGVAGNTGILKAWGLNFIYAESSGVGDKFYTESLPFQLYQNFPNPFSGETIISYELKTKSKVQLTIFDIDGKEIKTLVNQKQQTGIHEIKVDRNNLSTGIYFYQLKVNNHSQTKKLVITK